jgi:hypothetical protein
LTKDTIILPENQAGHLARFHHFLLGALVPLVEAERDTWARADERFLFPCYDSQADHLNSLGIANLRSVPARDWEFKGAFPLRGRQPVWRDDEKGDVKILRLIGRDVPRRYSTSVFLEVAKRVRELWGKRYLEALDWAAHKFPQGPSRILFVERIPAQCTDAQRSGQSVASGSRRRVIRNHEELVAAVTRDFGGCFSTSLDSLPLTHQAALFATADVIVAQHGAALANLLWAKRGSASVEIFPDELLGRKDFFGALAACLSINHCRVRQEKQKGPVDAGQLVSAIDSYIPPSHSIMRAHPAQSNLPTIITEGDETGKHAPATPPSPLFAIKTPQSISLLLAPLAGPGPSNHLLATVDMPLPPAGDFFLLLQLEDLPPSHDWRRTLEVTLNGGDCVLHQPTNFPRCLIAIPELQNDEKRASLAKVALRVRKSEARQSPAQLRIQIFSAPARGMFSVKWASMSRIVEAWKAGGKPKWSPKDFPFSHFDGLRYLQDHPQVLADVIEGRIESALDHYLSSEHSNVNLPPISLNGSPNPGNLKDLLNESQRTARSLHGKVAKLEVRIDSFRKENGENAAKCKNAERRLDKALRWVESLRYHLASQSDAGATEKSGYYREQSLRDEEIQENQSAWASIVPPWFDPNPGPELAEALDSQKPIFLFIPWIEEHGDALISKISSPNKYNLAPLDFCKDVYNRQVRSDVLRFSREMPHIYRCMIAHRLRPIRKKLSGVIFTFDWAPATRLVAAVCQDLGIPTILIPHESVFIDRQKYYWDPISNASAPAADCIFCWGDLQRDIFVERGYPENRILTLGAPKFDCYFPFRPRLDREQFCSLYGLHAAKPIILFACQPLDSQIDEKVAREGQRKAIEDLLELCEAKDCQLLVRLPPSKEDLLGITLTTTINMSTCAALDHAECYLTRPEESIYHSALVSSVNSTMLLEGLIAGRPALSMKYADFTQFWETAGVAVARSKSELYDQFDRLLNGAYHPPKDALAWAARMFSVGKFDGQATLRIQAELAKIAADGQRLEPRQSAAERILSRQRIDVVATHLVQGAFATTHKFLPQLLRANSIVSDAISLTKLPEICSAEVFCQWGITPSIAKEQQRSIAAALGRPTLIVEDGFIRSVNIGLSGEPGLSVIIDDTTAYYDATRASRLQRMLEHGPDLSPQQTQRSRAAINRIVELKISKYNHAKAVPLTIGRPGRPKVLVVDQRFGDQSVLSGLANEQTFDCMLGDVISRRGECDILIKQHPDAIGGGKAGYFSDERLAFTQDMPNVFVLTFDANPYSILELVDEVYVVTSGMGFEALMAGKRVITYGAPFYAGWGLTLDQLRIPERTRHITLEKVFHCAYIQNSRYYHPLRNKLIEVEEIIEYVAQARGW